MTRTNKLLLAILIAVVAAFAGARMQPFVPTQTQEPTSRILDNVDIDPATLAILERSCQNCHSEKTVWPWYSRLAPVSWLIARDVQQARRHANLSRWQEYAAGDRQQILSAIGSAVRNHEMPPGRYLLLHPEAKLTEEERQRIYKWTKAERTRTK